jgi:hypothetical protein
MAAQEDSLLSPITAAADRSESTTLLVAKVSYWYILGDKCMFSSTYFG